MRKSKTYMLISFALLLTVLIALLLNNNMVAHAQEINADKIILNGYYEECFSPDTAYVTMGVIEEVKETNSDTQTLEYVPTNLDMVLDTLNSNGIQKENIYTKDVNMSYDMFMNMRSNNVVKMVDFKTSDTANLNNILQTLSDNNATVKCIRYSLEDRNDEYATALNGAINNAVEKLNAMGLGDTYKISEVIENNCFSPECYSMSRYMSEDATVSTEGQVCIGANVKVIFEKIA